MFLGLQNVFHSSYKLLSIPHAYCKGRKVALSCVIIVIIVVVIIVFTLVYSYGPLCSELIKVTQ